MKKANIDIEFDVLDCTDKIIIYKMKRYDEEELPDAMIQHAKNIRTIQEIYKPKAIIRIIDPGYIKGVDNEESAIEFIDKQINELTSIKAQLLKKCEGIIYG